MKRVETIQTAIETRAKTALANDVAELHRVLQSNSRLLEGIRVQIPGETATQNLSWIFGEGPIGAEILRLNTARYIADQTTQLMKQVDERSRDLGQLRKIVAQDLSGVVDLIDSVTSMGIGELNLIRKRINTVINKIEGDE